MACDPQTLINNSSCIACNVPTGMQVPVLIYLLCQIQQTGPGGQLVTHFANSATVGTGATDLYSDSIPGNTLTVDGQRLVGQYVASASYGGVGYTATTAFTFAGQSIWSDAIVLSNPAMYDFLILITRSGTTTARCTVTLVRGYASASPSQVTGVLTTDLAGIDWTAANLLKFTGTSSTGAQAITAQQSFLQVYR